MAAAKGDHESVLEILVVDLDPDALGSLTPVAAVPPRVAVVRTDSDAVDDLVAGARFAIVRDENGTAEPRGDAGVLEELDSGARLFVEAWLTPRRAKTTRPGDGLPWDSPGFEPPDRPPQ